jgi:hypothetical protein
MLMEVARSGGDERSGLFAKHPKLLKALDAAGEALGDFYQACGHVAFGYPETRVRTRRPGRKALAPPRRPRQLRT